MARSEFCGDMVPRGTLLGRATSDGFPSTGPPGPSSLTLYKQAAIIADKVQSNYCRQGSKAITGAEMCSRYCRQDLQSLCRQGTKPISPTRYAVVNADKERSHYERQGMHAAVTADKLHN